MTDTKFCDLHPKDDKTRQVSKEDTYSVTIGRYQTIRGKRRLFENRLDACVPCITDMIIGRAKALNVPIEQNWKTEVLTKGASGKWFKKYLTPDEYVQDMEEQEKEAELKELRALRASAR